MKTFPHCILILLLILPQSKEGQVYFYPYGYAQYQQLVSRVDLGRDWVLISKATDMPETTISDNTLGCI